MKQKLGAVPILYPMPALLVGTYNEDGTPNAMTAAWSGVCSQRPPYVGVAVREARLTYENIVKRKAFTLNVPRVEHAPKVDYLGIVSGKKEPDKLSKVGLDSSPGSVAEAPLIVECPVNLECRLHEKLPLGTHTWFVGEIVEVHVDESYLGNDGKVDVAGLDPLVYCTSQNDYFRLGESVAKAFSVGKTLR